MSLSLPKVSTRPGNLHLPSNSRLASQPSDSSRPSTKAAVFLDRDGVLIEDPHFLRNAGEVRVLPGVPQALRSLQDQYYLIVATNQSGIARGFITEEDLLSIHTELVQRLAGEDSLVDGLYFCPHLPGAPVQNFSMTCDCRKPLPGMLLKAKADWGVDLAGSFMVGDSARDVEAGSAAGVQGVLVDDNPMRGDSPWPVAADLAEAALQILEAPTRSGSRPSSPIQINEA